MAGRAAVGGLMAGACAALCCPAIAAARDTPAKRPYVRKGGAVSARAHNLLPSRVAVRASAAGCRRRPTVGVRAGRRLVLRARLGSRTTELVSRGTLQPGRRRVTARLAGHSRCRLRVRSIRMRPPPPAILRGPPAPTPRRRVVPTGRLQLGAAVRIWPFEIVDPRYRRTFLSNFDSLTPENEMKWMLTEPQQGRFDLRLADRLVEFAERHGKSVRGHNLVWYSQLPRWLQRRKRSKEELRAALELHVKTLASAYRGRVDSWDVVNEPIHDDGYLLPTLWLWAMGPSYIEQALRWTREADPKAKLLLNEYGTERRNRKSDALYRLARDLKGRGAPLDGIGFQMHIFAHDPPTMSEIADNLRRFAALGLDLEVTELDVDTSYLAGGHEERSTAQAAVFADVAAACASVRRCRRLTTWGFTDAVSWLRHGARGLPFDSQYRPKPAWYALHTGSRLP